MAFFDRLGKIAHSVSDKTGDMLEIGRLNAQIRSCEDDIEELKLKLGEYYWGKFESGIILDEAASEICGAIREANGSIAAHRAEIDEIKNAASRNPSQAREKARIRAHSRELREEIQNIAEDAAKSPSTCPFCGANVAEGAMFCGACGTKLR